MKLSEDETLMKFLQDRKHAKRDIGVCWLVLTVLFAAIFVLVCVPAEMLP